jgi:phenylpropionate dioxygenase-like ring-hydroxylating dioxygenase large terminal subunit
MSTAESDSREWVAVLDSGDLRPGQVESIDLGERELVAWRSAQGQVSVMDARCPHQWSHLAAEGVVDGDELVCTAHFWRFDGQGTGSKVSIKGRRDPKADVEIIPSRESDRRVEIALSTIEG